MVIRQEGHEVGIGNVLFIACAKENIFETLKPKHNGWYFAECTLEYILVNENSYFDSYVTEVKCQWRGALMFSLTCTWINGWVNNRDAGDLRPASNSLWRHCNEESINKSATGILTICYITIFSLMLLNITLYFSTETPRLSTPLYINTALITCHYGPPCVIFRTTLFHVSHITSLQSHGHRWLVHNVKRPLPG